MPSSPVVIHHVQSSPVLMQQSQQSAALTAQLSPTPTPPPTNGARVPSPNSSRGHDRDSPKAVAESHSPTHQKKTNGNPISNGNGSGGSSQGLVIEELQNSQDKSKNRAVSIEAAEKEWEVKRQNMGHYDGREFEKILQEAQANMMKGIPNLDIQENPTLPPAAAEEQPGNGNLAESLSVSEEPKAESVPDASAKKGPEKLPKPTLEKPAKPPVERQTSKTSKPAAGDVLAKQGSEKVAKSPPPPPPRKTFSTSGTGMTTTRSGEVVFVSRKESVSSQEEDTPPPTPQNKPAKVPPETKPKPATPPPVTAPLAAGEDENDGDKIMAELQVFQKCTVKDAVVVDGSLEPATRIEPQIRELRSGALMPLKEKKVKIASPRRRHPANRPPLSAVCSD